MTMHADGDIEIAKNRLPSVLKSFHMDLIDVPQDEDCLFTSLGLFLQQYYGSITDVNSDFTLT